MALAKPIGIEIRAAPNVTISVLQSSGRTPKELGLNIGTQLVPKKNSLGAISWKKPKLSLARTNTMVAVVIIDIKVQKPRPLCMRGSSQRTRPLLMLLRCTAGVVI